MNIEENLFEDLSTRTVSHKRTIAFNLIYKGIEVEGKFIECHDSLWDEWHQDVVIDNTDDLTDEDIEQITDYILKNV